MTTFPLDEHGILLRRRALALGFDDNWLLRMRASGALVRMRHGAYVDAAVWRASTRAEKHVLLCRAVMQQYDDRVALSHASAHVREGGPDWGLDLSTVNVTNLFGRGDRIKAGITHHHGESRVGDVSRLGNHWITSPGRTAVDTAAAADLVPAIAVLDWSLNQKRTTPDELERYVHVYMRHWPMTIGLPAAFARCDGRSESIGETRSRVLLEDGGFRTESQFTVLHPSGRIAGIVDLVLPEHGVMVEFDGKIKYGRLLKPGQTIADVIMAERAREQALQELTGMWMIRIVWPDLDRPTATLRRVRELVAKKAAQRAS